MAVPRSPDCRVSLQRIAGAAGRVLTGLLLAALPAFACAAPTAAPTPSALDAATTQMADGAYTAAEANYRQALHELPDDPTPALLLVDLYLAWSRPDAGLAALEIAAARGAPGPDVEPRHLALLVQANEWSEVIAFAEADDNGNSVPLPVLAEAHLHQHDCDRAGAILRRHVAREPDDIPGIVDLALLEGDVAILKSLAPTLMAGLAPCTPDCDLALGLRLIRAERWGLAACLLRRAAEAPGAPSTARVWLGEALARLGRRLDAERELLTALDEVPESALAWLLLGKLLLSTGDVARARPALLNAQRQDPANPAPCLAIAELKAHSGHYDEVPRWVTAATERAPDDPEIWKAAARFYLSRHLVDGDRGGEAARAALRLAPEDPETHLLLGWARLAQDRPTEALAALEQALAYDPDLAEAHYLRAEALHLTGAPAEADAARIRAADLGHPAALP